MKGKTSTKSKATKSTATKSSSPALTVNSNTSAEVRQIKNGFIIRESWSKGTGRNQQWGSDEYFSNTNPLAGIKGKVALSGKKK